MGPSARFIGAVQALQVILAYILALMGKKQSVKKLAREKKKADHRSRQIEIAKGSEPQLTDRGIMRNILKKIGHGGKQVDAILYSMNDREVRDAIDNWKLKNELDDL